jgi:hypothetical protein
MQPTPCLTVHLQQALDSVALYGVCCHSLRQSFALFCGECAQCCHALTHAELCCVVWYQYAATQAELEAAIRDISALLEDSSAPNVFDQTLAKEVRIPPQTVAKEMRIPPAR